MPVSPITINTLKDPFADVAANSLNLTFAASTAAAGDYFVCTGREILIMKNGAGTNTVTISSVPNDKGRSEDLTAYELEANEIAYWTGGLTNAKGWKQTNGRILVTTSNVAVTLLVLRLPAGYP